MDFIEKTKVRLEHWISHNEHHLEEYEMFAKQLEEGLTGLTLIPFHELAIAHQRINFDGVVKSLHLLDFLQVHQFWAIASFLSRKERFFTID